MAETRHEGMDPSEEETTGTRPAPPVMMPQEPTLQAKDTGINKLLN